MAKNRVWFPFKARRVWHGNMAWDSFEFERSTAKRLLSAMRADGGWHCEAGPSIFYRWWNRRPNARVQAGRKDLAWNEVLGPNVAEARNATVLGLNDVDKQTDLISRLQDEADLCRNDGATDIAALLDEATEALRVERVVLAELTLKTGELIEHLQKTGRLKPCFYMPALDDARNALAN